jgi:hypothetical protein
MRSREDGAYYAYTWQAALASAPDRVIITSFNEWREGTYIEPSQAYGDRYLNLTAEWSARFKAGDVPVPTSSSPTVAPAPRPRPSATPTPTPKPFPTRWRYLLEEYEPLR